MNRLAPIVAAALLASSRASAQTLGGPGSAWTGLADMVLQEAATMAGPVIVIGLIVLFVSSIFNVSLRGFMNLFIVAGILTVGPAALNALLGAELP